MKISEIQEESIIERKLYLGVENFFAVAINPTLEELKEMGIPATEEPVYVQKVKRTINGTEQEVEQVSIRVFLDNKNEDKRIRVQANFNILRTHQKSSTGKYLVLNKFGASTWLEEADIQSGNLPSNMQWYLTDDIKKAYMGEPGLVDLVKSLYNLPYVNQKSTAEDKEKGIAIFTDEDIEKLFKSNFSDIRKLITVDGKDQKVGFLLGVRQVDDKFRQTVYGRMPLKSYVAATGKTDNLVKDVRDAQENGAYADTIFKLDNTTLTEFDAVAHTASPDASIGGADLSDDLPF